MMNKHNNPTIAGGFRQRSRRLIATSVALAAALGAAACGGPSGSESGTGSKPSGAHAKRDGFDPSSLKGISATLSGSGSTFQANFLNSSIDVLAGAVPGVTINYGGGGSGKGKTDLQNGVVDFAGTDSLVKDADRAKYSGELLYFPTVVAPITVPYRLDGVEELRLDGPTLSKIFTRSITSWNDPALVAINTGTKLPATPITVCHRSDASGTTTNFTKFLAAAGGTDWTLGSGDSIDWDPNTQGGAGNAGVAQCVKAKEGAIGYVDYSDAVAQKLVVAEISNADGDFVRPTLDAASAAVAATKINEDLTFDPINAAGEGAYPITSPTWVLVLAGQSDRSRGSALVGFLRFLLTDGQQLASGSGYAPLPETLADAALEQLDRVGLP